MLTTRDTLLKITQDQIAERVSADRRILAVYLSGSFLGDDHLLGGAGDIDLFFVHIDAPNFEREIIRLTDEIHLDIAHHEQKGYRQARLLRVHPWLGPSLNDCRVLHDPQHFMDFTVAGVRGQFERADHVYERASQSAASARQAWQSLQENQDPPNPEILLRYLRSVEHAANAIAALSGPPLTERRFLIKFPDRAASIGRPGLYPGLLGLLGAPRLEQGVPAGWVPLWQEALEALNDPAEGLPVKIPARLDIDRRLYYQRAFDAMASTSQPENLLWPLLHTWTLAVWALTGDRASKPNVIEALTAWEEAFTQLGLAGSGFRERLSALDAYLDLVEEILQDWAREHGV